ncbi:MAG TPA: DMT family transporter [Thermoplasmata archaeon]|nr:DMT family transporter [Thermoplasmata archaeon]
MNMVDSSILLALCSLVIYGLTQVIAKAAVGSLDSTRMVALNFLVSIPIYVFLFVCAVVIWGGYLDNLEYVFYGLIGASTARGGYYIYLEALERGAVSMVGSITAAFPAITAVLAVTMLGERLGVVNSIGITIIICSMIALSLLQGRSAENAGLSRISLVLSVVTLLIWGFGGIFIKMALDGLPLVGYLGLYVFVLPPIAFAFLRHKGATMRVLIPRWTIPVIGAIVVAELWQLGYFAETSAISVGAASVVFPLISAYPIVTILGARIFLKESLTRLEWTVLMTVVFGIVLTSIA